MSEQAVKISSHKDLGDGTQTRLRLVDSENIQYLNREHTFPSRTIDKYNTPRNGILGKISSLVSRTLGRLFLEDYLRASQEFNACLVRAVNELAEVVDKKEYRVEDFHLGTIHNLENRLRQSIENISREYTRDITEVRDRSTILSGEVGVLSSVVRGIERILTGLSSGKREQHIEVSNVVTIDSEVPEDIEYLLFENRFRGSEDEIRRRLSIYPQIFFAQTKPILEIGAGRGELQKLFKQNGISSYGIDIDEAMCRRSREQGLDVRNEDVVMHLQRLEDGSLGGIVAVQLIEHLPVKLLKEFLKLAKRKLTPGGLIACETINTGSVVALSQNYFRDPTHEWPLHPDTMRYMFEMSGIDVVETKMLEQFPVEAQLKKISMPSHLTPHWASLLGEINNNFSQLNSLLYGYQDYLIVGRVGE